MKRFIPWIILATFVLYIAGGFRPPKSKEGYDLKSFGKLPVLSNGRFQPMDSLARNSLLILRGKQTVVTKAGSYFPYQKKESISALEWMVEAMSRPDAADQRKIFRIDYPDLQSYWQEPNTSGENKYFSYATISSKRAEIHEQARAIHMREKDKKSDPKQRNPQEKAVVKLDDALTIYERIKATLRPPNATEFVSQIQRFQSIAPAGMQAYLNREEGKSYDEAIYRDFGNLAEGYAMMSMLSYALTVPPVDNSASRDQWTTIGSNLVDVARGGEINPAVNFYARITDAYAAAKPEEFNKAVAEYRQWLGNARFDRELAKGNKEFVFNAYQPFIKSMAVYVAALVCFIMFWFNWSPTLRRTGMFLITLALVVHTSGLLFRMYLEGRPPVTNLYSSAVFVGWGAVILGLILERIYKDGIGGVVAACVGFTTLIIAHHLSLSGDTMEMLQAVLDTNIWLATHVVVITLGYSSMFVAGLLAMVYISRGVFTRTLDEVTAKGLSRMVYGIICFATLFSFVGTILGGIWADQSWGRFWGWDPKENGALLIVLWNAVILHARWGGMIKERGLMNLALVGNIITSFSWFGVNMLGIGLHSYGFMDKAFYWLAAFCISQLVFIGLGSLPRRFWISFTKPPIQRPPALRDEEVAVR